jgi:collagenase-like PrtC family protease
MAPSAKLTLGPLLCNWSPERRRDFYFEMADEAPFDSVHLGEMVCAKRQPAFERHLPAVTDRLRAAGKEIVLSTLALVTSWQERKDTETLIASGEFPIEANDLAVVALLKGRRFMVGPMVNVYNEGSLGVLAGLGAERICLPAELSAARIACLAGLGKAAVEVQAFGRLPLAISARCYHARAYGLQKDGCRLVCARDPDGMTVRTLDGTGFLAVNGMQVLSHRYHLILHELADLAAAGVASFRLWPQDCDMAAVGRVFRDTLDGRRDAEQSVEDLAALLPTVEFANGFLHGREGAALVEKPVFGD